MNTPEILDKAADVIETRGWHQGGYTPDGTPGNPIDLRTCPVCVLGAIKVAAGCGPEDEMPADAFEAATALAEHLEIDDRLETGLLITEVVGDQWNDAAAESAEQVTAALRDCAAELRAGAS